MPVTTPCPDAEILRKLMLGELAPSDLETLSEHVLSCERCADSLNQLHPNDPLLQTLRGGDTVKSLPPLVQSLIARLSVPPAPASADRTVASLGESPEPTVDDLVSRWESLRKQGQVMSAEELCAGRPELLPSVRQRLDALGEMERLLATGAIDSTPSHTDAEADAQTSAAASALRPPQSADELGRLGGYRILKLLGQGGMGAVFLAEDPHLERHIALKVMGPGLAAKPDARRRFLREAKATAKLKNDHVVSIYQVGEDNGVPFLAMEYLEGESLDSRLRRPEKMPLTELLQIAREITQGLAAAHAKGLVHRDIKPANIWLEAISYQLSAFSHDRALPLTAESCPLRAFRVKILDFGLARGGVEEVQITHSGAILGTPAYMSPEQGRGETADARSDLFSLGCVLYRLCAGKAPFEGPTVMSVLTALATQEPAPLSELNRDIPVALAGLVMRLLAKRPEDRPASAQAVLNELQAIERQQAQESQTLALLPRTSSAVAPASVPEPAAKKQTQVQPRSSRHWLKVAAALLGVAAVIGLGGVIIRITGKDGKATELTVPDGSKVTIGEKGDVDVHLPGAEKAGVKLPGAGEKSPPVVQATISPLDKLDPAQIPASERFPWQPKELVAVIGKHERRSWWNFQTAAFSPDGSLAATGDSNAEVVIWDLKTQTPKMVIPGTWLYHFLPDGKRILLHQGNDIQAWDISGKEPVRASFGHAGKAEKLQPGGDALYAVLTEDGRSLCWVNQNLSIADLRGNTPEVTVKDMPVGGLRWGGGTGWVIASKSSQVFYITKDKKVHRATIKNGRIGQNEILPIRFSEEGYVYSGTPDGRKLVVWADKEMQVWDLSAKEPKIVHRITDQVADRRATIVISPDGKWLAAKYNHTALFRLDAVEPKLVGWLDQTDSAGHIGAVAFSADGCKAIVANHNGLVRFWDLSGSEPKELEPFDPAVAFVAPHQFRHTAFDPRSGSLVLTRFDVPAGKRLRLQWWNLGMQKPQAGPVLDAEAYGPVSAAGPDRWLQTTFEGYRPRQYRLAEGKVQRWREPFAPANMVGAVAPDGRTLILISAENRSHLEGWDISGDVSQKKWDLTRKDLVQAVSWGDNCAGPIWFAADGRWFATQTLPDKDGAHSKLVLWRNTTPTPEVHATLPITWGSYRAALSPDGCYLAHTPTSPEEIVLLDLTGKTPREVGKFNDSSKVRLLEGDLAFHPDGKKLAVGSLAGVCVLEVPSLKPLWYWKSPGPIAWLDWAADGRHLVTHNGNMTLYVLRFPWNNAGQAPVAIPPPSVTAAGSPLDKTFTNSLGMKFVLIPRGKSWLGGGNGNRGTKLVDMPHDFYLGRYEVTQEEWEKVTGLNPSHFQAVPGVTSQDLKRFPVERVSWGEAEAFAARINEKTKEAGWVYRLPTELEWEYACRGGPMKTPFDGSFDYYFQKPSSLLSPGEANFEHGKGLKRPCKVGSYEPNPLGLYDMHGNVQEWCQDKVDNKGISERVHRGGCWLFDAGYCRAAARLTHPPSDRFHNLGLRLARVPAGQGTK